MRLHGSRYSTYADFVHWHRVFVNKIDLFLCATQDGLARVESEVGRIPCKSAVVPIPCSWQPLASVDEKPIDEGLLVFVGYDWKRKGLPMVLEAYKQLRTRFPDLRLAVVTSQRCPFWGSDSLLGVSWHANLSNNKLHDFMHRAAILVVPTLADNYNLVMVEAMASGCVVVSSNIPNLAEVAPPGEVSILIDPTRVDELVFAVTKLLGDRALRTAMARRGLELYKRRDYAPVAIRNLVRALKEVGS